MQDYVRNTNELVDLSKAESRRLFAILEAPSDQNQDIDRQNQANTLKIDSATLADRAHNLDVPDQLSKAQGYFVEALELRRDALSVIAEELPKATAQQARRQSTARIAEMMRVFDASDVLMRSRFRAGGAGRAQAGGRGGDAAQGHDARLPTRTCSGSSPISWPTRSPASAARAAAPRRASTATAWEPCRSAAWRSRRAARPRFS